MSVERKRFGNPHRKYNRFPRTVSKVLKQLQRNGKVSTMSQSTGIPRSTLYDWRSKLADDPCWNPVTKSKSGQHRRIFTDKEENQIAEYVRNEFIAKKQLFTDLDFRDIIMSFYRQKVADGHHHRPFSGSHGFISDFKKRHRFSSRKVHYKRRGVLDPEQRKQWIAKISQLLKECDSRFVLNCDETFWSVYPGTILTWAETSSEAVSLDISGSEKDGLTVLATIAADGTKLPLFFIAQGKTVRVEETQVGPEPTDWVTHTESGWQTSQSFSLYLMHLRETFGDQPLHLLLDMHSSHRTEIVKELAKNLDVSLHFIPPGATDELQPLDRRVFGVLKATARRLFRERPTESRNKRQACADLRLAWECLGVDTLEEAWECY